MDAQALVIQQGFVKAVASMVEAGTPEQLIHDKIAEMAVYVNHDVLAHLYASAIIVYITSKMEEETPDEAVAQMERGTPRQRHGD